MSAISTLFNELRTQVQTEFPDHYELINPYLPEFNDDLTLDKAFGITFLEAANTVREFDCRMTITRTVEVVLTRKMYKGSLQRGVDAVAERTDTEKTLLEDHYKLVKRIEKAPTLSGANPIIGVVYASDGGVEFVRAGTTSALQIRIRFDAQYFEDLS